MIDLGADAFKINKIMFDTKSRAKLNLEKTALENMEFFCKNKCAVINLPYEDISKFEVCESDFDGISAIPRQIEGILVGVLIKEKEPGIFKISVRTDESINASKICENFNGGGHRCAAGCTISGNLLEAKNKIVAAVSNAIDAQNERNNNCK